MKTRYHAGTTCVAVIRDHFVVHLVVVGKDELGVISGDGLGQC